MIPGDVNGTLKQRPICKNHVESKLTTIVIRHVNIDADTSWISARSSLQYHFWGIYPCSLREERRSQCDLAVTTRPLGLEPKDYEQSNPNLVSQSALTHLCSQEEYSTSLWMTHFDGFIHQDCWGVQARGLPKMSSEKCQHELSRQNALKRRKSDIPERVSRFLTQTCFIRQEESHHKQAECIW